ncbi:MAG: hypothetical protein ACREK3_07595 [Gemmatimonadota bacterium]
MPEEPEAQELPERWSARRKTEIVLRLLRGEDLGALSREIQVSPPALEDLAAGVPRVSRFV